MRDIRLEGPGPFDDDRHRCPKADEMFYNGEAVLFYDEDDKWVLAFADAGTWHPWYEHKSTAFPLITRMTIDYETWVPVEFCPWCSMPLLEDPEFINQQREYEAMEARINARIGAGGAR